MRAVCAVAFLLVACGGSRGAAPPPVAPPAEPTPAPTFPGAAPSANPYSPGLEVVDVRVGTGQECKAGDRITVRYVGTLDDGTEFDRSDGATFPIGQGMLIKGWDEGVPGMRVGGMRKITIPASLGYGSKGSPPKVPPFSRLHFEIELLTIEH